MILTSHIIAGAAVAAKIKQPWLGLPLAVLSHFFLDSLPHREYSVAGLDQPGSKNFSRAAAKILADASFGLAVVIFSAPAGMSLIYLTLASALAVLPDFFLFLNEFRSWRWLNKLTYFHRDILHMKPKPPKTWGWISQFIFTAAFWLILTL